MSMESVIFGIDKHRVQILFDRSRLSLGSIIYVEFSSSGEPVAFYLEKAEGRIPYWVRWISGSEWYVELIKEFQLRPEFVKRVEDVVGEFISHDEINTTLKAFSDRVRPSHFFKTRELEQNPLSVVFTVLERLDVCSRLSSPNVAKALFCYHEPLVTYLLLTCFDRLGQPTEWLDFGAWLKSKRHKDERKEGHQAAGRVADLTGACQMLHSHYLALYGVKSSFFRFLREVLPPWARRYLLNSIEITKCKNPPFPKALPETTDEEKEAYLFKRRNDYTHKAAFTPPAGEWLGRCYSNHVQEFRTEYWTDTVTTDWPAVLEKTVRIGLASYLRLGQRHLA